MKYRPLSFLKVGLPIGLSALTFLLVPTNSVSASFNEKIEAEDYTNKNGSVYVRNNGDSIPTSNPNESIQLNNASGSKFVDFSDPVSDISTYKNTIPEGKDSATWKINVPKDGFYELHFVYNNPGTETNGHRNVRDERNFRISINNSADPLSDKGWAGWMVFNISGYNNGDNQNVTQANNDYSAIKGNTKWNNNYMNVHLNKGENTLTLTIQAPPGQAVYDGPNLDYIDVTDITNDYVNESEIPYLPTNFKFKHDGILYTYKNLDRIKENKNNLDTIDGKAYQQLKNSDLASANYQDDAQAITDIGPYNNPNIGGNHLTKDSFAASSNIFMWYFDGDQAHAKKAIQILNDWTSTLKTVGHATDAKLRFSLNFPEMINTAEILKNVYNKQPNIKASDKWQQKDINNFDKFIRSMMIARGGTYSTTTDFYPQANGNWDALTGAFNMTAAIYLNDVDLYNAALKNFYIGNAATDQLSMGALPNYIYPTGESQETSRDQAHVQLGINGLALQAQISWNQGLDLFSAYNNRLLKGVDYVARYNLGQSVKSETFVSDKSRGKANDGTPAFEILMNHYLNQTNGNPNSVSNIKQAAQTLSRAETSTNESGQSNGWIDAALLSTADNSNNDQKSFKQNITVYSNINYAQLFDNNGNKIDGSTLPANSNWISDAVKTNPQGKVLYRVASNKWIQASDVYSYQNISKILKLKNGHKYIRVVDEHGRTIQNRALSANSNWKSDKIIKINNQDYYRVGTNEFVSATKVEIK
ncbi:alginate lyase family protein [Companilactobacillus sp. HBUAS56257]|uniref:alginate lyase family protein n=1 Tax=Companilactobacillus sp. HBUAS56257 TaxID=3109360 RepID=UPI002FEF62CE